MPSARASSRGRSLNERFGVNGSQYDSRSLGFVVDSSSTGFSEQKTARVSVTPIGASTGQKGKPAPLSRNGLSQGHIFNSAGTNRGRGTSRDESGTTPMNGCSPANHWDSD